uniref:BATXCTL35 n=1 Tax=Bothrops atrox TaxID=8725 RepID=A0A1L8D619_BOTAT
MGRFIFVSFGLLVVFLSLSGTDTPFECPSDWSTHRQYCYKFFQQKKSWHDMNWDDAERFCSEQAKGGHLVSIESDEEASFVAQLVAPKIQEFTYYVWIGLRAQGRGQQCTSKWSDGSCVCYENLVRRNVKKCFALGKKLGFVQWVNIDCVERNPFVCKFIRPR